MYSTGNGFSYGNSSFYPQWAGSALTAGDFDGDGRTDIFVCPPAGSGGACFVMYSTGNGFNYGNSSFYPQWAGIALTVGDFNGDGKSDVFVCPGAGSACFPMYSTGNGFTYGSNTFFPYWGGVPLTLGDFNGDGKMDLLACPSGVSCYRYFSTGGNFASASTVAIVASSSFAPELIGSIGNGLSQTVISSSWLTNSAVYTKDATASYPHMDLQLPLYVVVTCRHLERSCRDAIARPMPTLAPRWI